MDRPRLLDLRGTSARAISNEDLVEADGHVKIFVGSVQENHNLVAVCQWTAPDLCFANAIFVFCNGGVDADALNGFSARILTNGDNCRIIDDGECRGIQFADIVAQKKR